MYQGATPQVKHDPSVARRECVWLQGRPLRGLKCVEEVDQIQCYVPKAIFLGKLGSLWLWLGLDVSNQCMRLGAVALALGGNACVAIVA